MKVAVSEAGQEAAWGQRQGTAALHDSARHCWTVQLCVRVVFTNMKTDRERARERLRFLRGCFAHRRDREKPASLLRGTGLTAQGGERPGLRPRLSGPSGGLGEALAAAWLPGAGVCRGEGVTSCTPP